MKNKEQEYKEILENLGVKNVDTAVRDLFDEVGYVGRIIIHYWFHRTNRQLAKLNKNNER